jgi:oligopeptide/dipeptide ABC transporter ATP-binding protein
VRRIFNAPAHPYTRALVESIPRLSEGPERLTAIDGHPPDLISLPAGCSFHPRCPQVVDRCRIEAPSVVEVEPDHSARCWVTASGPWSRP